MRYEAIISDVQDPEQRGRVRLKIPDLFFDSGTKTVLDSPWADPKGGGGSGFGVLDVPPPGTAVAVTVEPSLDGTSYRFVYERAGHYKSGDGASHAPAVGRGVDDESVQLKVSAPFTVPSPRVAMETRAPDGTVRRPALLDERLEVRIPTSANAGEYPKNHVLKTPAGSVVEWDDTAGARRVAFHHPSGAGMEVGDGGVWTTRATKQFLDVLEHIVHHVGGDERVRVDGNVLTSVGENVVEEAVGRRVILASEVDVKARFDLLMEASQVALKSRGNLGVKALSDAKIQAGGRITVSAVESAYVGCALGTLSLVGGSGLVLGTTQRASLVAPLGVSVAAGVGMDVTALGTPGTPVAMAAPLALMLGSLAGAVKELGLALSAISVGINGYTPLPDPSGLAATAIANMQAALTATAVTCEAVAGVMDANLVPMASPVLRSATGVGV